MRNSVKHFGRGMAVVLILLTGSLVAPRAGAQAVQPAASSSTLGDDLRAIVERLPTPLRTVLQDVFQLGQRTSEQTLGTQLNPSHPEQFVEGITSGIKRLTDPLVRFFIFLGNFVVSILVAIADIIKSLLARA